MLIPRYFELVFAMIVKKLHKRHDFGYVYGPQFPRNAEFWAKLQNLPVSTECLCFHGILLNLVLVGDKGTNMAYFGQVQEAIENYLLYTDMIMRWNTWLPLKL